MSLRLDSPFEQLPNEVKHELVGYLENGNDKIDLCNMILENMTKDQMVEFIEEVRTTHKDLNGDYPHTAALLID